MEMSSQMSSAANRLISDAWAVSSASHASLVGCRWSATASYLRVLGLELLRAVLVRGRAGDVVAAVRVRARLARLRGAVLGLDQQLVRRGRRGLRVLPGRDLLAQHRDDLAAEQLELVEDLVERQARGVHQGQLALVVTKVLAERQGLVDDLLRAADGQRRHRHEVLHRRAVAVDRRLVEVGPELALGVLGILREVRLAAEADDRLLLRAVAVVGEAL